jgi:hypothetical protein
MSGSVSGARWVQAAWLAAYLAAGLVLLVAWSRDLDALALGEEPAAALGVPVERAARRIFLAATLLAAATVAAAGLVGFVGLIVPHLARAAGARSHRALLLAAALAGASLVVGPTSRRAPCAPPPSFRSERSRRSSACRSSCTASGARARDRIRRAALRRRRRALPARRASRRSTASRWACDAGW